MECDSIFLESTERAQVPLADGAVWRVPLLAEALAKLVVQTGATVCYVMYTTLHVVAQLALANSAWQSSSSSYQRSEPRN